MFEISLKSESLKKYLLTIIGKKTDEPITDTDLRSISTLKLNSEMLNDLAIQDLAFFDNLQSLSLSGINIGDKEIAILNRLKNVRTLSISNAKINLSRIQYLNANLKHLIFNNCEGINIQSFTSSKLLSILTIVNCKNIKLNDISDFKNLEEINLPNNETLTDKDVNDIWNVEGLKKVNLDGSNNVLDVKHEGIDISHDMVYKPTESKDWDVTNTETTTVSLNSLSNYTHDQLKDLSELNIRITAEDIELLKSEKGQQLINALRKGNTFDLSLHTTADMSMSDMEYLNSICKITSVHVQTGWAVTQEAGYSYQTYRAIKKEIMRMVEDIDPSLSDSQKYMEIRKRITEKISYDYSALQATPNDKDYYSSRNLENAILNHTCVCAGYADTFKNVLAECGIQAKYVEGKTDKGELHAWNQVRLKGDDGKYHWYNDDVTFDAVGKDKFGNSLVTDEEFSKTHICFPERTEGGYAHKCDEQAPAAVRATKKYYRNLPESSVKEI